MDGLDSVSGRLVVMHTYIAILLSVVIVTLPSFSAFCH